jgi:energy-converting hydrogenase Eha subunit A
MSRRPWLAFLYLAWVSLCGIWWLTNGGPAWQPILMASIAIGLSAIAGHLPFWRTSFTLLLFLFSLTALMGVWASYDRAAAWDKFWVLALALFIFDALASQPRQNLFLLCGLICLWGALLSLNFLLVNDWRTLPADFRIITRIGLQWMSIRPALQGYVLTPNVTAGILAGFFPFTLALGLSAWQEKEALQNHWWIIAGAFSAVGLMLLTIFLTSSRGAWIALAVGTGFWSAWVVAEKIIKSQVGRRKAFLATAGFAAIVIAFGVLFTFPGIFNRVLALAPGLPTGQSRLGIDRLTLPLIGDFPFTGGGLGAFAGLFSHYMLVIPHLMFTYSHNFYLDVALEQGLAGLALLLMIFLGSAVLLFRSSGSGSEPGGSKLLRQAALSSLVIIGLHGLVDDPFYGIRGTPFLWVVPGIAAFIHPEARSIRDFLPAGLRDLSGRRGIYTRLGLVGGLILAGFAWVALYGPNRLGADWLANRGAVLMAQVQLRRFPQNVWDHEDDLSQLEPVQGLLEQAVQLDPLNLAANYRLGLIALQRKDFQQAVGYLEAALQRGADHRGVIKNLGYAYVWAGQYDLALPLLAQIPEAKQELQTYIWWWAAQDRNDLAQNAEQMKTRLAGGTSLLSKPAFVSNADQQAVLSIR